MAAISPKILNREWLEDALDDFDRLSRLWRQGRIPEAIEGFMLLTPLRRMLRCIYDSNIAASAALTALALDDLHSGEAEDEEAGDA